MHDLKNSDTRKRDKKRVSRSGLGRRDLMRLGAAATVAGILKRPAHSLNRGRLHRSRLQVPWPHENTDGSNISLTSAKVRKS